MLAASPDIRLRLFVRNAKKLAEPSDPRLEIVEGDTFNPPSLDLALSGIDTAYYLIHSMGSGGNFRDKDRRSAELFRDACIRAGVRRIIYLGGLGVRETCSVRQPAFIPTAFWEGSTGISCSPCITSFSQASPGASSAERK